MSFSSGFTGGFSVGGKLGSALRDNRLNEEIEALNDFGPVEIGAPEQLESEGALARGEPQTAKEYATRYQFGDKVYSSKPPQYEVDYAREQRRAELLRKKGEDSLAESVLSNAKTRYAAGGKEYYDDLARRSQTLFYDDLGVPLPIEQILGDETRRTQALGILNDYAFEDVRNADGNFIRVKGFTPTPEGRFAMDLEVIDPKTGEVLRQAPVTRDRSSKAEDPVVLFTPETAFPRMLDHLRGKSATFADIDNKGRVYRGRQGLIEGLVVPETGAESYAPAPSTSAQPQGLGGERPSAPDVADDPSTLDFSVLRNAPASAEAVPRPAAAVETPPPADRTPSTGLGEAATRTPSVAPGEAQARTPSTRPPGGRERTPSTGVVGEHPTITSLLGSAGRAVSGAVDRVAGWAERIENGEPAPSAEPQAPAPIPSAEPQRQAPVSSRWSPNMDWKPGAAIRTEEDAQGAAVYHATRAGLPPELFLSLVQQESGWNTGARSNKGASGLGQLMPGTAGDPGFGVTPLRNNTPEENLRLSADYLKAMLVRYNGNVPLALAAYNAGPGAVDKAGGVPKYKETQDYVRRITSMAGDTGLPERDGSLASWRPQASEVLRSGAVSSRQASPRGLDAAIRMATHFPNEVSVKDVERYANTGRLAEPQYLRDFKGGGAAVDPYTGSALWERAAPQTPMTAAEQEEAHLKISRLRHQEAQARMKTIEQVGKQAFKDDYTPEVGAMMAVTMDARGIAPTQENLPAIMYHAKRTTEAVQKKMKPLIRRGPEFRSYSVGMAAGALGLTETDAGEIVDRLVKPMQSIVGGENIDERTQLQLMIGLGTVQERAGVTPSESAQLIQTAMRYGFRVSDLLQHIEQAKEEGVQLTPSRYEQVLAQQTGRRHAE